MEKAIEYKLTGKRRVAGAIGMPESFKVFVSHQSKNITPKDAMNSARESMYQDGYDKILFISCHVKNGRKWENIPMLKALGLE
jgi:hypothetical protein